MSNHRPQLREGLERLSLQHLVLPMLSVDEYESKIDDRRMIVVGFMVRDYQPARDLSQFIEKSNTRPADTDVSPAPTDDGFYLVFVELERDDKFPDRVIDMVHQVDNLTGDMEWRYKPYGQRDTSALTAKSLRDTVNLDPDKVEIEPDQTQPDGQLAVPAEVKPTAAEAIGSFMRPALCETVQIRGQWISISSNGAVRSYRIRDWRESPASIPVFGLAIGSPLLKEARILENCLGPAFAVDTADDAVVITDGERTLILGVDS